METSLASQSTLLILLSFRYRLYLLDGANYYHYRKTKLAIWIACCIAAIASIMNTVKTL